MRFQHNNMSLPPHLQLQQKNQELNHESNKIALENQNDTKNLQENNIEVSSENVHFIHNIDGENVNQANHENREREDNELYDEESMQDVQDLNNNSNEKKSSTLDDELAFILSSNEDFSHSDSNNQLNSNQELSNISNQVNSTTKDLETPEFPKERQVEEEKVNLEVLNTENDLNRAIDFSRISNMSQSDEFVKDTIQSNQNLKENGFSYSQINSQSNSQQNQKPSRIYTPTTIHTSIIISVDVNHRLLAGYVDLYLKNTTASDIHELQLNVSDQMKIEGVFEVKSFDKESEDLSTTNFSEVVHNKLTTRETMAYANSESSESSECERSLSWAMDIRKKQIKLSDAGLLMIKFLENWKQNAYLRLRIYYQIVRPASGIYFCDDLEDEELNSNNFSGETSKKKLNGYCYTCNFSGGARTWFPCLDSLETFSSYEIEITTHKDAIVVCTGNLVEQTDNNEMGIKTIKFIHEDYPIPPYAIGFAIGPFKVYIDGDLPHITHFFPPKYPVSHIRHTVLFLRLVLDYFHKLTGVSISELSTFYNLVYLDAPYTPMIPMYSLGIVSTDFILDPTEIDNVIKKRIEFSSIIATQYFGGLLLPKYLDDFWIVVGLSRYMSLLFLENAYGINELTWYLIEKCEEMPKIDNATMSLSSIVLFPQVVDKLVQEKSPLVFYMLGQITGKMNMDACIQNFVTKALIRMGTILDNVVVPDSAVDKSGKKIDPFFIAMEEAIKETKSNRVLSTKQLRTIMTSVYRIPKQDIRDFFGYWVDGRGFPQFQCAYTYDPKRSKILIALRQLYSLDSEATVYVGKIRFAIHEKDFLYSREVKVDSAYFWTELDCTSKPRKNQKKPTNANEVNYEIPIHYIIPNSGLQVMCQINMWQDVAQWIYQVEGAKDFVGLYSAVRGLKYWQSQTMFNQLKVMLHSNDYYFRIRFAVIDIFTEATRPELADQVYTMLREAFSQKFCDKTTNAPLANDFSNIIDYYLKRKLITAFGLIRRENGYTPDSIVELIRSLLQNNDNSRNKYSDTYYIATLLQSLTNMKPQKHILNEVERWNKKYLVLDSLIPSQQSHFSVTTLENLTDLFCTEKLPLDLTLFEERLRPEVNIRVRETALQCLNRIHDKIFRNQIQNLSYRKVFFQVLDLILDGDDPPIYKHRLCRVLIEGINKCSARVDEYDIRKKNSLGTSLENFLKEIRSNSKKNRPLVERLWKHTLDHRDLRMQSDITDLYLSLWGYINAPSCYCREPAEFVHAVRIDKYEAILYDPEVNVVQYREPDTATTSETSVGFKVTRMTIIEGEDAPPFVGAHSRQITTQPQSTPPSNIISDLPTPNIDLVHHTDFDIDEGKKRKREMGPPKRKKRKKQDKSQIDYDQLDYLEMPISETNESSASDTLDTFIPTTELSQNYVDDLSAISTGESTPFNFIASMPNTLEGETILLLHGQTLNISPHEKTQVLQLTEKIIQTANSNKSIKITPPDTVVNYNYYCELIVNEGTSPIIIPIEIFDTLSGKNLYKLLPIQSPVLNETEGLIYTHSDIIPIPKENPILQTSCQLGEITYWHDGRSITIPYGKTLITNSHQFNQRIIALYGECESIATTLQRLPPLKKALNIQFRRGRSFSAVFTDKNTNEELCTVHGCLNHTVHALDFFKRMTPFLFGDTLKWNQMLGFVIGESNIIPKGKVIQNYKTFQRNLLEKMELALWSQFDETKTKVFTTLIMGTGPGVLPEKLGKYPLVEKCNIIGKFKPSPGFEELKNHIQDRDLNVLFKRNYIFVHINSIVLEMNVSETLTSDYLLGGLPIEGICQHVSSFIVVKISGLNSDKISTPVISEAKSGTLVYWTEKSILLLCLKDTSLPGKCTEIATIIDEDESKLEQIASLDVNAKMNFKCENAEPGVNLY